MTPDLEIPSFLRRKKGERKPDLDKMVEQIENEPDNEPDIEVVVWDETKPVVPTVKDKSSDYIAQLEEEIDKFCLNGHKACFDAWGWFVKTQMASTNALRIKRYYEPLLEELYGALNGKDEQLVEAYRYLRKPQLTAYAEFISAIVKAADTWNKKLRKPRAPRTRSAAKQVAKLTYCKEHLPLQLISLAPDKVVGANEVWVFDVAYNKLTCYLAKAAHSLGVKGSTLQNFDEAKSISKRLRKPEKVLAKLAGSRVCHKVFDELKTKAYPATGRINKNVLILKVF